MSAKAYEFSAAARLDLLHLWNYLADTASVDVADKVIRDIHVGLKKLVRLPKLGHARPDLTDPALLPSSLVAHHLSARDQAPSHRARPARRA